MMLEGRNCEQHHNAKAEQWQTSLSKRGEDLIEATCCTQVCEQDLSYGVGSFQRTPKLLSLTMCQ